MNYKKMILIIMFIPFISIAQNEKWVFMGYWTYENIPGKCSKKSDYGLIKIRKNANYSKNLSSVKKRLKNNYPTLSGITFYETTASKGGVYKVYKINSWCNQNSKTYKWTGYHVLAGDNTIDDRFNNYVNSISNVESTQTYITGFLDLEINGAEDEVFAIQGISMVGIGSKLNESNNKSNASEDIEKDQIAEFPDESEKNQSENKEETGNGVSHFIDDRDGKKYRTITYTYDNGEKVIWMAENLAYKTKEEWSHFDNSNPNDGLLYRWKPSQTVCPKGWSLPSSEDWDKLTNFFGGEEVAGLALKSNSGWHNDDNGDGTSEFNVLPTGYGLYTVVLKKEGMTSLFWSSKSKKIEWANHIDGDVRWFDHSNNKAQKGFMPGNTYACVRCIKK